MPDGALLRQAQPDLHAPIADLLKVAGTLRVPSASDYGTRSVPTTLGATFAERKATNPSQQIARHPDKAATEFGGPSR